MVARCLYCQPSKEIVYGNQKTKAGQDNDGDHSPTALGCSEVGENPSAGRAQEFPRYCGRRAQGIPHNATVERRPRMRNQGDVHLYQRKRSPFWWIRFSIDSVLYRESTKTTDEEVAKKIATRKRNQVGKAREDHTLLPTAKARKISVCALLDELEEHLSKGKLTAQTKSHLKPVRQFFDRDARLHWTSGTLLVSFSHGKRLRKLRRR